MKVQLITEHQRSQKNFHQQENSGFERIGAEREWGSVISQLPLSLLLSVSSVSSLSQVLGLFPAHAEGLNFTPSVSTPLWSQYTSEVAPYDPFSLHYQPDRPDRRDRLDKLDKRNRLYKRYKRNKRNEPTKPFLAFIALPPFSLDYRPDRPTK